MANIEHRIHWVASNIVSMMQDWPEMKWEDVQGINRRVGFAHRSYGTGYMDNMSVGRGHGRLGKDDLRKAWELAQMVAHKEY